MQQRTQMSFLKLKLNWRICLICLIFLPNLPNSVKIKNPLNVSKFKMSSIFIKNILGSGLDTWYRKYTF